MSHLKISRNDILKIKIDHPLTIVSQKNVIFSICVLDMCEKLNRRAKQVQLYLDSPMIHKQRLPELFFIVLLFLCFFYLWCNWSICKAILWFLENSLNLKHLHDLLDLDHDLWELDYYSKVTMTLSYDLELVKTKFQDSFLRWPQRLPPTVGSRPVGPWNN